jgi:four helix bundle protein
MKLKDFRSYRLSVEFYRRCEQIKLPGFLRNQLLRAASSISLNLAEGNSRPMGNDRARFYRIALGSLRECQAVLDLNPGAGLRLAAAANELGANLYRLCHPKAKQ